jgi:hypothetical protein
MTVGISFGFWKPPNPLFNAALLTNLSAHDATCLAPVVPPYRKYNPAGSPKIRL